MTVAGTEGSPVGGVLDVERVEWRPSTADELSVRVCGRWRGAAAADAAVAQPADAAVELVVDGRRFRALSARSAGDGAWVARFAAPVVLRGALSAGASLRLGSRELPLPPAVPAPADDAGAPPPATVVAPGVLESLRSRREGLADEALMRRAQTAEATVETLETQLGLLESGLRSAEAERSALAARLREAEQREEAERRVRSDAERERDEAAADAERRLEDLRARLRAAEQHAHALAAEIDGVRREGAEAQYAAVAARAAAQRAERDAREREAAARAAIAAAAPAPAAPAGAAAHAELAHARAELAAARAEAASRTAALHEAERTVEAARRVAAELQERLDEERRLRQAAEAALPPDADELAAEVEALSAAREAFARQAEAAGAVVAELRARLDHAARGGTAAELARVTQEREALAARLAAVEHALAERDAALAALRRRGDRPATGAVGDGQASAPTRAPAASGPSLRDALRSERVARRGGEKRAGEEPNVEPEPVVARELESTRRELAAAQEQLAAERARSDRTEALREQALTLIADLGAAESRLKEREQEQVGDREPRHIPPDDAVALEPHVVGPRRRPSSAWLTRAVAALARSDEPAAAELLLELLPAQGGALRRPLAYGLTIEGRGAYRIDPGADPAIVAPADERELAGLRLHIAGRPAALAPLAGGGASRRLRDARVTGRRRLVRRLLKARRRPLDLADLAERGIRLGAGRLLAALAATVDPAWTGGCAPFAVRYLVDGDEVVVAVAPGSRLEVSAAAARDEPDVPAATVYASSPALLALLGRTTLPRGEEVVLAGDRSAVTALHDWFARAQGLARP